MCRKERRSFGVSRADSCLFLQWEKVMDLCPELLEALQFCSFPELKPSLRPEFHVPAKLATTSFMLDYSESFYINNYVI